MGLVSLYHPVLQASEILVEPVQACVIARDVALSTPVRANVAHCLGWQEGPVYTLCRGNYLPLTVEPLETPDEVRIHANNVSFYNEGRSELSGNVEVLQTGRLVNAQTAYVYRDAKSNKVTEIELLGEVKYLEPGRLMIARKVTINPEDKSGKAEDVLYRFNAKRAGAVLPAWGRASLVERFSNKDYLLEKATYSTCAPENNAWHIEARKITLDDAHATGTARDATLYIEKFPIFYTPYLNFPTSKERKSGFLLPTIGNTSVGGFDFSLPYYWNIAPNYDATITPHLYARRGVMLGGQFRYLTSHSFGQVDARYLSNDRAYHDFILNNELEFPQLRGASIDRWSIQFIDLTQIAPNLKLKVNYQQVSDNYFLQDFSSNFAVLTERQLLREGELSYTSDNWLFRGMLQSYQTLKPVNEPFVNDIYQRLPQLMARGEYADLPFNSNLELLGQYDNFHWPNNLLPIPEGSRFYVNPIFSMPQLKSWGYITPSLELVQNYYDLHNNVTEVGSQFNRTIPRYSIDSGLYFDRETRFMNNAFTQTLEPRLYYLNVPFHNQSPIPVFDSAYMIFNTDQLFRTNRFSGYDRIGDTNQLSYALTTRWLSDLNGMEKASFTVGQIRYFEKRRVQLCQNINIIDDPCIDNPLTLGYLSPFTKSSPVASRASYHFNPSWLATADFVWDPNTNQTNNGHVSFNYQPAINQIISAGYTYLVDGDLSSVNSNFQNTPLHQAIFSYAWPFSEKWSTLAAFNYNISKRYDMMSLFGLQYDDCCWAVRLVGGRAFQSLSNLSRPEYNTSVYFQVMLKGLGSVGYGDPAKTIHTFVPGYVDSFH